MDDLDLLNAARKLTGSDSETARRVGMRQQHICHVRNGRRELSAAQAAQIAELCGKNWIDEALHRLAKKEKSAKARRYWLGKLPQLRGIAATVVMGGLSATILVHGGTSIGALLHELSGSSCILCYVHDTLQIH